MKRTVVRIAWIPLVLVMLTLFGNGSPAPANAPTRVDSPFVT